MSKEAHESVSPTWDALQKVGEQCLRPQQTPTGEGGEPHRQRIAEAICDGYYNGNQPFSEAPLTVQHSCRMAAEAVMALSHPVAEKPAALAHPQQGGERDGWKLVPVEPSEEQVKAGTAALRAIELSTGLMFGGFNLPAKVARHLAVSAWKAMVPAAPTSPSKSSEEEA